MGACRTSVREVTNSPSMNIFQPEATEYERLFGHATELKLATGRAGVTFRDTDVSEDYIRLRRDVLQWPLIEQSHNIDSFIWSYWEEYQPAGRIDEFHTRMEGFVQDGNELARRVLEFALNLFGQGMDVSTMVDDLNDLLCQIHRVTAAIEIRSEMVQTGIVDRYSQIPYIRHA